MNITNIVVVIVLVLITIFTIFSLATTTRVEKSINDAASIIALPEATNYVVNDNGVLSQETVDELNKDLANFDGRAQIAVLVLDSTSPYTIEEYGIKLAEKWKVGYSGVDNGAIIILATVDKKVRIEVGKGLEGDIPDAAAGRVIDEYMIPALKEKNFDNAIKNGVMGLKNLLKKQ